MDDLPIPIADSGTCETEVIASKAVNNGSINAQKCPTIRDHAELTAEALLAESTPKTNLPPRETIIKVLVGNISMDTTKEELLALFGLRTTLALRKSVRIKLISDSTHKFSRYALVVGPRHLMNRLVSGYNGYMFKNRKLVVEFNKSDKSAFPKGKRDLQRGEFEKTSAQTSGYKTKIGGSRPASSASSKPEKSVPCTNREQGEFRDANPEVVGDGTNNLIQSDKTMAQNIRSQAKQTSFRGVEKTPTPHRGT